MSGGTFRGKYVQGEMSGFQLVSVGCVCVHIIVSICVGTFVAGVSMMCCSRPQRENIDYSSLLLINIWVAIFQLISSILFLIGWIWSVIWGFNFIAISSEFYVTCCRMVEFIRPSKKGCVAGLANLKLCSCATDASLYKSVCKWHYYNGN